MGYDSGDIPHLAGVLYLEQHRELDGFLAGVEKRAFRMAEIAIGNREDALDIVQDAMCRLVERYGMCKPEEWGPLFRTILHNRIQDWRRREAVHRRFRTWFSLTGEEDDIDPMQLVADEQRPGPERVFHNGRSMAALDQALRKLSVRQQQVFMLRVLEGLDVEATAGVMRCSTGSVKTHFSRAVQTLRRELKEHW